MWDHPFVACRSLIFLVQVLFLIWISATSFLMCADHYPLIGVVTGVVMTTGCSAGPPLCYMVITALSPAGFSPQFGVEARRSISQLWCEIGGNAALPLGEKPLSIPLPDQATRRCTLGVICRMDSQSTLLLALPPAPTLPMGTQAVSPIVLGYYAQKAQDLLSRCYQLCLTLCDPQIEK